MSTYKFKKGDRVRAVRKTDFIQKGETGTALENANSPYVQWDKKHRKCYTLNETPNVWAVEGSDIELVKAAPKKAAKKAPAKAPKKKAEPKLAKPTKRSREIVKAFEAIWVDVPQPRVRIGSIVEYSDRSVMIVMFYDESEHERENEPDEEKWFKWGGPQLDSGRCDLRENMWVSQHMIDTGDAKIIGHFDIYSLVNGNDKR